MNVGQVDSTYGDGANGAASVRDGVEDGLSAGGADDVFCVGFSVVVRFSKRRDYIGQEYVRWCRKHSSYPEIVSTSVDCCLGFLDGSSADTDDGIFGEDFFCFGYDYHSQFKSRWPVSSETYAYHPAPNEHPQHQPQEQHPPDH